MKISVCIITYNRPEIFKQALQSCLDQTLPPTEILVGDDSSNDATQKFVEEFEQRESLKIQCFHNERPLKQAGNINNLFEKAQGDVLVLLHDDDLLMPEALKHLHNCFMKDPTVDVAFGKQYIISEEGVLDSKGSEKLNRNFYRTAEYEGSRLTSLESGFLQQFPNDAYMVRSEVAKSVMYREDAEDACDFDFGLRLGMRNCKFYFLNQYTAKYRLSSRAISKNSGNNASLKSYGMVRDLVVPVRSRRLKARWLTAKAPLALRQAIRLKKKKEAIFIFFSRWHRNSIFTASGFKNLFLLLFPHGSKIKD